MEVVKVRRTSRTRPKARKAPARRKKKGKSEQDSQAAMMAAWKKSMTPGKGHQRLDTLVGTFDVKLKMWMQPGAPPSEGTGRSVQKWVLGGRYLQQTYRGKSMDMPFQGVGYTAYDNVQKKYTGSWMDSMGTGIMTSTGIGRPTAKKIEFESVCADPMSGKNIKMRSIIRIQDKNRNSFEMLAKGPGGKEFRTMLIEYKRRR